MNQNQIHELLQLFVGSDPYRPKFMQPWRDGENVFATENHIMIRIRGSLTDHEYPIDHKIINPSPWDNKITGFISTEALDNALSSAPLVDELKSCGENKKCPECHGEGKVTWEYEIWTKEFDCPVCDGEGYIERERWVPSGRKIISDKSFIRIENKIFKSHYIDLVRRSMAFIGVDHVEVGITDECLPALFRFTPDIDLILMPCNPSFSLDSIHAEIPISKL